MLHHFARQFSATNSCGYLEKNKEMFGRLYFLECWFKKFWSLDNGLGFAAKPRRPNLKSVTFSYKESDKKGRGRGEKLKIDSKRKNKSN